MKGTFFLSISIISAMFVFLSCEKAEIQKLELPKSEGVQILTRGECELCPDEDECCCVIYLQEGAGTAGVRICGTSNYTGLCSFTPPTPCSAGSNGGTATTLIPSTPAHQYPFCMTEGNSFTVTNASGVGTIAVVVSCQSDLVNADTVHLQIGPNGIKYLMTNDACELIKCN